MKYIVYLSTASMYFKKETLEKMLVNFRINNENNQITGMMLFSEGLFLQVLEGNDQDVDKLLKKIEKDKRHHSLVCLDSKPITQRIFADWSMGFSIAPADDFKAVKGFADPSAQLFHTANQEQHPAILLLKKFAQGIKPVTSW